MGIFNRIRVHRHDIVPITGGVQSTLTIKYDSRQVVSSTREFQYGIKNLVSDTIDLLYGIRNTVSDTLEIKYTINGFVSNILQLVYSVLAPSITASFKQAKHLGSELETIDEMPAIPKTAIISSTGFHVDAELTVPEYTAFNIQSGLLVPNVIPIHASSESLMKREYVGSISASLKVSNEILVKMESKFKSTQPIGIMKAEISFAPIYRIIQNNLQLLLRLEDVRNAPQMTIQLSNKNISRGTLLGVKVQFSQKVGQVWMRILSNDTQTVVQKPGLMAINTRLLNAIISTKELKAGEYTIHFSNHRNFSPLVVEEFKVKGGLDPAILLLPALIGLGGMPAREPKPEPKNFTKIIFKTMQDVRVDPVCKAFENKKYSIDDPTRPEIPIHPNCRCWYEPILVP